MAMMQLPGELADDLLETREGPFRMAGYLGRAQARAVRLLGNVTKSIGGASKGMRAVAKVKVQTMARMAKQSRQAIQAKARYMAYSSDVGEAARPLVAGPLVWATYAIAVSYVATDVTMCGVKAKRAGKDVVRAVSQAALFQSVASLAVPGLLIHQTVHTAQKICAARSYPLWMSTVAGLAVIPALPTIDHPIEQCIESSFEKYWPEPETKFALDPIKKTA
mmetsp:Transcript_5077/g.10404  ORF Transcript_5077/g.10404 Transcript_5077/m.10404 type:complete len:221 (-) Transcript_5077:176-838(-)|eukprot:CAMPEP_0118921162 /NCGR_PEP_ID=MMETSP1169-20130426/534_1 /TAXON_ID=36882 /ORGANISM="Pyramimonas obovata, Strain CCMP722" /LENGTH=220 /DNA_ID=CAMNT_0006861841 /DNA_START=94 /DNA_END=759 /DNA_ORIENTATION=+